MVESLRAASHFPLYAVDMRNVAKVWLGPGGGLVATKIFLNVCSILMNSDPGHNTLPCSWSLRAAWKEPGPHQALGFSAVPWRCGDSLEMSRASRFGLSSSFLRAAEENVVAALQEKDGRFDILSNVDGVRKHVSENKNVKVSKR